MAGRGIIYSCVILFLFQLCLSSCAEDDLKKAPKLGKNVVLNRDRTTKVDIIYSDSAKVKAQGFAPVLEKVTETNGTVYQEMPKGVKINFLDEFTNIKGSITSDYAIMKDTEKTATFRRNVVVVNDKLTFNTDELVWDQNKRMFFSPKGVITKPDGTRLDANNFNATEDFSVINWSGGSGETYVPKGFAE